MKRLFIFTLTMSLFLNGYSQDHADILLWSSTHRLTTDDFGIKKDHSQSGLSFAQFSLDYSVNGFDFLTRNFNKKVKCTMLRSASWIDTTAQVETSLSYQQTLFDLLEIYARKFRKELRENRRQIAKGLSMVHEIHARVTADFAKRRLEYDEDTQNGSNAERQKIWEQQIKQELLDLSDFKYDK